MDFKMFSTCTLYLPKISKPLSSRSFKLVSLPFDLVLMLCRETAFKSSTVWLTFNWFLGGGAVIIFISEKDSLPQDMKTGRVKNTPSLYFQLLSQFVVLRMVKNTDQFESVFHARLARIISRT